MSFNRELIDKIYSAGIKVDDYKYVDLYSEYICLKGKGEKVTYIVSHLSSKYLISERFSLKNPIYLPTASYGHFGREPQGYLFGWERTDMAETLTSKLQR